MQCDNCSKRDATVHLTQIVDNKMSTFHLCEGCAAEKGLTPGEPSETAPLTGFLAQMGKGLPGETAPAASGGCPACGLTLSDLKRTGRLGCGTCYAHFDQHLRALLRRLHGGTQHAGKIFFPPDQGRADQAAKVMSLRRSLQRAVESEDFERAAMLRDQIRTLEGSGVEER